MACAGGLQVHYLPLAGPEPRRWDGVLGVATFDRSLGAPDIPVAEVRTPVLGASGAVCEVWRIDQATRSGSHGRVRYRHGAGVMFGCITLSEAHTDDARRNSTPPEESALHAATEQGYREVFATLDTLGYPHLLRVWNYLPEINQDTHGVERYRQFNDARRKALAACGRDLTGNVPAACALGSVSGSPLVIYFLASQDAPAVIENPRQVSAYEYPEQYGPKPVFSRASVLRERAGAMLFISGTSSIVGHRTVHAGDAAAQTRETLTNIEALLGEANRVTTGASRFDLGTLAYKVYVRKDADLPTIQSQLRAALGPGAQAMYLRADICRQDLLVEIEAIGQAPASAAA
ncbi:MAG TPA: hypothetical protein VFO44_10780 [Steroidobacteraceae bacterium]|nr:hypothetical protein [Steroidobacteraceae bacterium]